MAVVNVDDFTNQRIKPGNGWELRNAKGQVFHVKSLSGLLRALATQGTAFGMDEDKAIPKLAGLRVAKAPSRNGKR